MSKIRTRGPILMCETIFPLKIKFAKRFLRQASLKSGPKTKIRIPESLKIRFSHMDPVFFRPDIHHQMRPMVGYIGVYAVYWAHFFGY